MKSGELYSVAKPGGADPRRQRVFLIVSRQTILDSRYSTVICAPVYTRRDGLATQVELDRREGLKHESCIHCDGLVSLPKSVLTNRIGMLSPARLEALNGALRIALALQ